MSDLTAGSTDFFASTEIISSARSGSVPISSENDLSSDCKSAAVPKLEFEYCSLLDKIKKLNLDEFIYNRKDSTDKWDEWMQEIKEGCRDTSREGQGKGPSRKDGFKDIKIKVLVLHSDTDSEILDTMRKMRQSSQYLKDILLLNMIDIVIFENIYSLYRYLLALELDHASNSLSHQELESEEYQNLEIDPHENRGAKNTCLDDMYRTKNPSVDYSTRVNTRDIKKIIIVNLFETLCDAGHSLYIQQQAKSNNAFPRDNFRSDLVIKNDDFNVYFLNDLMIRIIAINEKFDFSIIEKSNTSGLETDDEDSSGKCESLPVPLFAQQFEHICELHSDLKSLIQNVMNDADGFQYESLLMDVDSNQDCGEISLMSLRNAACKAFEIKCLEKCVNAKYVFFDEFLNKWK